MFDARRFDKDFAIEVAEHPFRPALGTIHSVDPEELDSGGLHTILDLTGGLDDEPCFRLGSLPFPGCCNHPRVIRKSGTNPPIKTPGVVSC